MRLQRLLHTAGDYVHVYYVHYLYVYLHYIYHVRIYHVHHHSGR
jgi:hypothetical protein